MLMDVVYMVQFGRLSTYFQKSLLISVLANICWRKQSSHGLLSANAIYTETQITNFAETWLYENEVAK